MISSLACPFNGNQNLVMESILNLNPHDIIVLNSRNKCSNKTKTILMGFDTKTAKLSSTQLGTTQPPPCSRNSYLFKNVLKL